MTYGIKLRPELLDDVAEAYRWYEERATGLGDEFLRSYYAGLARIQRHPTASRKAHLEFRCHLLRRFPYYLYYRIEHETVIVVLLFHRARNPGIVQMELRKRHEERPR